MDYGATNSKFSAGEPPREISTRSSLSQCAARLAKIDSHLADAMREHWDYCEPPQPASSTGPTPKSVTHPTLLSEIDNRITSIAERVEYIAARL